MILLFERTGSRYGVEAVQREAMRKVEMGRSMRRDSAYSFFHEKKETHKEEDSVTETDDDDDDDDDG